MQQAWNNAYKYSKPGTMVYKYSKPETMVYKYSKPGTMLCEYSGPGTMLVKTNTLKWCFMNTTNMNCAKKYK